MFDINEIRSHFPVLQQKIYGRNLVYLDNAATTQKPKVVIDALLKYYSKQNSNIHRGVHFLSQQATQAFEEARIVVKQFINANHLHEIIFTRGTTESINLVASSFGKKFLSKGDEIILSVMEHHSNIVPWQLVAEEKGAIIKVIPINDNGEIIFEEYQKLLCNRTKIVAIAHVSNALGTINPIKKIIDEAHQYNIPVLIDGAQAVAHTSVDVQQLDCDFYCFSGHKMYAPMGVGVLYGKEYWLNELPPYQGGGEMIKEVTFEKTTYNELPFKFEAGTPNVGDVIGLQTAIEYILQLDMDSINSYENQLLTYATQKLKTIDGIKLFGCAPHKAGVISFLINHHHPYDMGVLIDKFGIALRTGHHCAQPVMDRFNIPGTLRASFAVYNTYNEIDQLYDALIKAQNMLS